MRGIQVAQYVKASTCVLLCATWSTFTDRYQALDDLKVTDLPDPKPGPDEYLIEVHAAATNFFDILQVQGKYQHQPRKDRRQTISGYFQDCGNR
jgi:D-arabinose 1-dehydrogenase-like Zn-dependent alcohol dehydrogenase